MLIDSCLAIMHCIVVIVFDYGYVESAYALLWLMVPLLKYVSQNIGSVFDHFSHVRWKCFVIKIVRSRRHTCRYVHTVRRRVSQRRRQRGGAGRPGPLGEILAPLATISSSVNKELMFMLYSHYDSTHVRWLATY